MIETFINGKHRLMLPEHRHDFYKDNNWEAERMDALHRNITKQDVVADIGAEEGEITALLAEWSGGVYVIEASPGFWPNIKEIFKANDLDTPLGCFVGFASDENEMNPPNLNFEGAIVDGWPLCAGGNVRVGTGFRHLSQETDATPQMRMDMYLMLKKRKPTVLNIDCEGSELRILKGAQKFLELYKPLVFVSIHPDFMEKMYGQKPEDVAKFMTSLGYNEDRFAVDHEVHTAFWHPKGKKYLK